MNILMVAAECKNVAKIGGLADVVYDLSSSLVKKENNVSIILPYYDIISINANFIKKSDIIFGNKKFIIDIYFYNLNGIKLYLIKSKDFFSGKYGSIYINSPNDRPFEDDSKRFAFFCKSIVEIIKNNKDFQKIDIIHCHDWHSSLVLLLLKYDINYSKISKKFKFLFTIHNLDYQGIRPFEIKNDNDLKSFSFWFPDFYERIKDKNVINLIKDPKSEYPCINLMRTGINLSDFVNTVSPTYANEIIKKDDMEKKLFGGRGLEDDLSRIFYKERRLVGILNGINYDEVDPKKGKFPYDYDVKEWHKIRKDYKKYFIENLYKDINKLELKNKQKILNKVKKINKNDWINKPLFISITRAVSQKFGIIFEKIDDKFVYEEILKKDLNWIVIGKGELEDRLQELNIYSNFIFINAFASELANDLYRCADIFLMPSDFEPCGISQLIAMRYGSLPIVHNIGGLHDTVKNMDTGFTYYGTNRISTRYSLIETIEKVIFYYNNEKEFFYFMQQNAMKERFSWDNSTEKYISIYKKLSEENF